MAAIHKTQNIARRFFCKVCGLRKGRGGICMDCALKIESGEVQMFDDVDDAFANWAI